MTVKSFLQLSLSMDRAKLEMPKTCEIGRELSVHHDGRLALCAVLKQSDCISVAIAHVQLMRSNRADLCRSHDDGREVYDSADGRALAQGCRGVADRSVGLLPGVHVAASGGVEQSAHVPGPACSASRDRSRCDWSWNRSCRTSGFCTGILESAIRIERTIC